MDGQVVIERRFRGPPESANGGYACGIVDPRVVWAALDCPTGNGALWFEPPDGPVLLGRLTARLLADIRVGGHYVVMGWGVDRDGRKHHGGSAIFDPDGEAVAYALGTWIELRDA